MKVSDLKAFNEEISKVVEFMTNSKKDVKVDTNLIKRRVIGLQESSRDLENLSFLSHERVSLFKHQCSQTVVI